MPLILASAAMCLLFAQAPTDAGRMPEAGSPKPEAGSKKQEAGSKKQEAGSGKPEAGTQKPKAEKTYPVFELGDDHPEIQLGKGSKIEFRARFAGDYTDSETSTADPAETSDVDLGTKRIGISGEIKNAFEYQVEAELDSDNPWRDVYGDFKYFPFARVRGGQFKIPFSLDENTGASRLDFMFRSLAATHLAPGRDRGVMLHGRILKEKLRYEAGVFEHDGRNARTNNPDKVFGGQTTAVRVSAEPLRNTPDAIGDLSFGVAFTQSDVPEGTPGLRGQTVLRQTFFSSSDYIVSGPRKRLGVELEFLPGPASIKMEWMRVETERRGLSVEETDLSPLIGEGWYVSGTYAITGEKKSRVQRPKKPLFQGGFGAVEVGARIESLRFRSGASGEEGSSSPRADVIIGNRNQVATFGVNWYINRFFKIQANFIREKLDDPLQGPLPSKEGFNTRAIRFQFSM